MLFGMCLLAFGSSAADKSSTAEPVTNDQQAERGSLRRI
jgi:hypothetical protein